MLVCAWAPNRPGFAETESLIATWSSLGIAAVAVGFAFIRDWRTAVRGVCFGLGFFGVLFGAAFPLFAAAALCGLIHDGRYGFLGGLPAGVWVNDLIAMAFGIALAVASRLIWKLGSRIAEPRKPRSGASQ